MNNTKEIKRKNPYSKICYNPSLHLIKSKGSKLKSLIKYSDILDMN